jgi:putative CocE/NonD family hydrolase
MSRTKLQSGVRLVMIGAMVSAVSPFLGRFQSSSAQAPASASLVTFVKGEEMIPMRDGIKLHTVIFTPNNSSEPLPILLTRTPYGANGSPEGVARSQRELAADGYIFVRQDIRGRFTSEGQFMMNRPPRDSRDPKAVDESTDTYDTIDWLVKNIRNSNGNVGVYGISYPGWLSGMALLDPHPALKAVSPQGTMADTWMGDDFFHNGAFRLSYGYEYAYGVEITPNGGDVKLDTYDTYDWYLKAGPLSHLTALLQGKIPTWKSFVEHPAFDEYWQKRSMHRYLTKVTVPTMNVAGWWDQEDFYGPIKAYEVQEKNDSNGLNFLVAGPWNHGGWAGGEGDSLGRIQFKNASARYFREKIQAPFFAHYLKGKDFRLPEATCFETGSNKWMAYDQWPPVKTSQQRKLYLHANGRLSFDPPQGGEKESDSYVSDPAHPVPYRHRPIETTYDPRGSGWYTWLVEDQRFVTDRPDVLAWQTEPLTENITIAGDIMPHLFASTSGSDSDWVVKLIDVYPQDYPDGPRMGGYQLMIAGEVMRGRYYKSFEKPEALIPGKVTEFVFSIRPHDHTFLKGHRIMVQVQSSWFPMIDRNPQRFVPNIFNAKAGDFQAATQHIFHSNQHPSYLAVPVVTRSPE